VRIAFLINGMTGYLNAEFKQLHALGNDLLVVTPVGDGLDEAMADTEFRLDTRDFAQVHGWQQPPDPAALVALVRDFRPDAVIMTSWNFAKAYRSVMKSVPPTVVRALIMDNLWRAAPKQWLGRAVHRIYVDTVADAAMVPSERTERYARRLGFAPADIIRGSLTCDTALFHSGPRTGAEIASHRSFLYVGRLVWHKGADVLAASYRRYRELVNDPWDLHVVGKGPLQDELAGIPGVTMHGFVQPPAVAQMMRAAASCYLLTSHIEPYGVVIHEAAASGLPILCSDFAGAAAGLMQDGRNGWVVESGNVELWAQAMARMSALDAARLQSMSDISRALASRFSPEGWALNLHEELARRKAAGGGRLSKRYRPPRV
jgi:glycosyltransferase involved in cell wall biosynthesis